MSFSALQRAEIAEMRPPNARRAARHRFSALQRAEIAEIVDVLNNVEQFAGFSALQRAEIAEIELEMAGVALVYLFQCSSTSRNC